MRRSAWVLAAALAVIASPAAAQGVKLVPGEEVVFALDDGTPVGAKRVSTTPNAFEAAVGRHFSSQKPPEAPVTEGLPIPDSDRLPPAPEPVAGKLRFRFVQVPGADHALLVVDNGYAKGLLYRARITSNGRTGPTDVCLVMPGKGGVEHWPYAIASIELSGFELVDWTPEDGVPCK